MIAFHEISFAQHTSLRDEDAKAGIDERVELRSGTGSEQYNAKLVEALEACRARFTPDLVFYNAGEIKIS